MHGRRTPRLDGPGLAVPPLPAAPLLALAACRYGPSRRTSNEADGGVQNGPHNGRGHIQPRGELADYLGVPVGTLRRWGRGGTVNVDDAERICIDLDLHPMNVWGDLWLAGIDPDSDPMEDHPMFVYTDGGRADAGYRGAADDCVVRAIAIAAQMPYRTVYDALHARQKAWLGRRRKPRLDGTLGGSPSPRNGVHPEVTRGYMADLGWAWHPTMQIGSGTNVHLRPDELPAGRLVVQVSRHICAVIDGIVHDTADPSREGTRAVYGYWTAP